MKVLVDENLPARLARALDHLFPFDHVISVSDRFGTGAKDIDWITQLGSESGWIVISGDRRITRNHAERAAFRQAQLTGFFLSKGLLKAKTEKQAQKIIGHWENMRVLANTLKHGSTFEVPESGKIKPL